MGWVGWGLWGLLMAVVGCAVVLGALIYTVGPAVWLIDTLTRRRRWSAGKNVIAPHDHKRGGVHGGGHGDKPANSGCGCGG